MEKSYCEFMDELSSDELYEGLLAYGMFADKLPPIFTSESFYNFTKTISQTFNTKWKNFVYFESVRQNNIPRPLGIPNPLGYQQLCKSLADNWDKIKEHFHKMTDSQSYKVSRLHLRKQKDSKILFEMNYKNWKQDGSPELNILIGNKYVVKSDISTCFPSIYTHSIAWAIATKSVAKTETHRNQWYNELDTLCSNLKNGETHGLLIGPHASNLISEIILTCVDKKLIDNGWQYIRNIDDYTCYVSSHEQAEKFLTELNEALREFDLPINYKKTTIQELPKAATNHWIRGLSAALQIEEDAIVKFPVARSYLDTAISLMESNDNDAAVLKYAIKVIGKRKLTDNAKNYCLKTIEHYAVLYPYLITLMDDYVFTPFNAGILDIQNFSNIVYNDAKRTDNYELMYYAVFFAIKYNFNLIGFDIDYIIKSSSCLLKLFAWIYCKQKKDKESAKKIKEYVLSIKDTDFEQNWILCYEVLNQTELKNDWKVLKKTKISFIKDEYHF